MPNNVRIHTQVDGNAGRELKSIRDGWDELQHRGTGGLAIAAGVTAGAAAFSVLDKAAEVAIGTVTDSIRAASDLRESMTLTEQVFGNNTDAVVKWAAATDDAFSQTEALNYLSQFANLLQGMGVGLDEATAKSEALTKLAGDLGSAFNTSSAEAADAIKSGLIGESEPIRRFGVILSETAVQAEAVAMGIAKSGGKLTDSEKALARYSLIMKGTTRVQGTFGKDTESLADAQKLLQTNVEDLEAALATKAIPTLAEWTKALADAAAEAGKDGGALDTLGKFWTDLNDAVITSSDNTYEAQTAFGQLGQTVNDFADDFVDMITPWDTWTSKSSEREATLEELRAKLDAVSSKSMPEFTSSSREMGRAMDTFASRTRTARIPVTRMADKVKDLVGDFKDLDKWAGEAGDTLAESAYGPEELRLKFEGARIELRDNEDALEAVRKKIKKLEDDGKPVPRALKKEFNEAKQAVNESKQEVIRLGTKLEVAGGISMADLRTQFQRLGVKVDGVTGKAADLWWYLRHIADVDLGTVYDNLESSRKGGKASGGYEPAGSTFAVGEQGKPELVTALPGGGVMVSPMDGRGAWGLGNPAAPMTTPSAGDWGMGGLTVIVQAPAIPATATPGTMQAYAETVGPAIASYLQKRQLIAPARR